MKTLKKASPLLLGLASIAMLAFPALADKMNARITAVDPAAHTFTVIEGGKNYTYSVNDATKFVNAKDQTIVNGINSGDLKAGTRLSITYSKDGDTSVASEVKLRDLGA